MVERWVYGLALLLFAARAFALVTGEPLPPVSIGEPGELLLVGERIEYRAWDSAAAIGKLHVIQYLAARRNAREIHRPFTDRLEKSGIPLERYQITTIVDLDDAMFGTRSLVMSELESNKRRYFQSVIVADGKGSGRSAWSLPQRSSTLIVMGPDGRLIFFREGALSEAEIEGVLALIRGGA